MIMKKSTIRILGVMTGTSCDGLDAACLEIDAKGWRPLWSHSAPYPKPLKRRVLLAQAPLSRLSAVEWLTLNRDLGLWYGKTLHGMIRARKTKSETPHLIANHGQTIAHFPKPQGPGVTLQLGDPTLIAAHTGLSVASHFRDGDLAAGGQGAPLVPLFHKFIADAIRTRQAQHISIHNIGGISNFTYLGPHQRMIALDTGPGNIWIDGAATLATQGKQKMDVNGRLALAGRVNTELLKQWLKHPYFKIPPPKSTGRNDFPISELKAQKLARGNDLVATATAFTIETIAQAYERYIVSKNLPLDRIYVCGGGAKNPSLMNGLLNRLAPVAPVMSLASTPFDPQLIEAQAFALFGYFALRGSPIGGSWTGARKFGPPALLTPGENWADCQSRVW
jgi:anhydro-N-acetylmuramic acid kinase